MGGNTLILLDIVKERIVAIEEEIAKDVCFRTRRSLKITLKTNVDIYEKITGKKYDRKQIQGPETAPDFRFIT